MNLIGQNVLVVNDEEPKVPIDLHPYYEESKGTCRFTPPFTKSQKVHIDLHPILRRAKRNI